MYSLDDSFDDLNLDPSAAAGGGMPPIAFDPTSAAIQVGIQVAKFIPGIKEVVGAPGKLVGKIFGFGGGAKKAKRRMLRKKARAEGRYWGEKDCKEDSPYFSCTGKLRGGGCSPKQKPLNPKTVFGQYYTQGYQPCINAQQDARDGSYKQRLWEAYPEGRHSKKWEDKYKSDWEARYERIYNEMQQSNGANAVLANYGPLLIIATSVFIAIALRGKAK